MRYHALLTSGWSQQYVQQYLGYPSSHDALANNNVYDSNRLQNHTPRNPFRSLKQQRKHHSISHRTRPHSTRKSRRHSRPRSRHADHTAGISLIHFAGGITSRVHFSKFAHPHHSVYCYFTACRVHTDFSPCGVTAFVFFCFFFYSPADGEKQSFSSPHFHVFSYASCVDLTKLLSQPNASWRTLRVPL